MDLPVQNITDLQSEILRLTALKQQQQIDLKRRFSSPSAIFATAKTLFPRKNEETNKNNIFNQDILGLLSRVVLPFTLNKTLFKNSNFIVKSLIGLLSQKASTYISEDSVGGVWSKVRGLVSKFEKKPKPAKPISAQQTVITATPGTAVTTDLPLTENPGRPA